VAGTETCKQPHIRLSALEATEPPNNRMNRSARKIMEKKRILAEIKRLAVQNGGKPLGRTRFEQETGIKESDWNGKLWARWSDAIVEAGFSPNTMTTAYTDDQLLMPLVKMIREVGHFPTQAEQGIRRRNDTTFPPPDCIRRRWNTKGEVAARVVDYCLEAKGFEDVAAICLPIEIRDVPCSQSNSLQSGHVYLLKHDNAYKIGKSTDASRRYKEIRTQMPHETEEIHAIETDDISGIESYWHHRFRDKRLKGEWFRLSADDVRAFKKRRFM
jgi:hypothetical protein